MEVVGQYIYVTFLRNDRVCVYGFDVQRECLVLMCGVIRIRHGFLE
jgi:hypothetical protein